MIQGYAETITADGGSQTATYTYDANNRLLTKQTLGGDVVKTITYTYDPNGNLLGKRYETGKTSSEGSGAFALSQLGQEETLDKTAVYEYDGFNRLSKSFEGKHTVSYQYNGLGLRVSKTTDGQKEYYAYDQDKVALTLDAAGGEVAHDLFGHHLLRRSLQGETLYYWYNGHGDVVALLDAAGSVVALYAYDAFGVPKQATGKKNNPYRYAGYAYDEETGLYYLKARYYDAEIGRFLQRDTYAGDEKDPLSLHRYTYCQNNPMIRIDPDGLDSYVLYDPYMFDERRLGGLIRKENTGITYAKGLAKEIKRYYGEDEVVHLIPVTDKNEFIYQMNIVGKSHDVNALFVLAHSNPEAISFRKEAGSEEFKKEKFTLDDMDRIDNPRPIDKVVLLGCNLGAGKQKYTDANDNVRYYNINDNLAQAFLRALNTPVLVASDGLVYHSLNDGHYQIRPQDPNRSDEAGMKLYLKNAAGQIYKIKPILSPGRRITVHSLLILIERERNK